MQIRLNGKPLELEIPVSLAELLQKYGITQSTGRLAVALNERIAPRMEWDSQTVNDGDRIEIIQAVQGG
jgi:thiamine biosynthesis protein ThiS